MTQTTRRAYYHITIDEPSEGYTPEDLERYRALAEAALEGALDADVTTRYGNGITSYTAHTPTERGVWESQGPLTEEMQAALETAWNRFLG